MLDPLVRRSLAPRGEPAILHPRTRREKLSVIAGLSLSPQRHHVQLFFRTYPNANVNAERAAEFLENLLRQIRGNLIVVWDGASIHRGPAVRELLSRTRRLTLQSLAPYAPELNPVEYLWSHLKYTQLVNVTLDQIEDLDHVVTDRLERIATNQHRLRGFYRASPIEPQNTTFLS